MDNKNKWIDKYGIILKVLTVISMVSVTVMLTISKSGMIKYWRYLISMIISSIYIFKTNVTDRLFKSINRKYAIGAIVLTALVELSVTKTYLIMALEGTLHGMIIKGFFVSMSIITSLAIFIFFYVFISKIYPVIKRLILEIDIIEKIFLISIGVITVIVIFIIYSKTVAFTYPPQVDIVYTLDTRALLAQNVYVHINAGQNDIRQPLFGLLSLPFSTVAYLASKLLFYIPDSYIVALAFIQVFVLLCSYIMLTRVMKPEAGAKIFLLIIMSLSYSTTDIL